MKAQRVGVPLLLVWMARKSMINQNKPKKILEAQLPGIGVLWFIVISHILSLIVSIFRRPHVDKAKATAYRHLAQHWLLSIFWLILWFLPWWNEACSLGVWWAHGCLVFWSNDGTFSCSSLLELTNLRIYNSFHWLQVNKAFPIGLMFDLVYFLYTVYVVWSMFIYSVNIYWAVCLDKVSLRI